MTNCFFSRIHIACVFLLLILGTSCNKDSKQLSNIQPLSGKEFPVPQEGFRSLPTMPTVYNGMLKFNDQAHFDSYLAYLDALVMDEPKIEGQSDTDPAGLDEKLLLVEQNLGFSSLRAKLEADFEVLNTNGFATLADIPAEHFIRSSSMRSIFNENQEVKIGGSIFIAYSVGYLIEITDSDLDTRDAIQALRKDFPDEIPPNILSLENVVVIGQNGYGKPTASRPVASIFRNGPTVSQTLDLVVLPDDDCNGLKANVDAQVYDYDADNNQSHSRSVLEFSFNWGDGTTSTDQPGGAHSVRSHTYSTAGTYNVTVRAYAPGNPAQFLEWNNQVTVSNTNCTNRHLDPPNTWAYSTGNTWAYECDVWKTTTNNRGRSGASTKAYQWANGAWRLRKADRLVAQLVGNSKRDDCLFGQQLLLASWPTNTKKAEVCGNHDKFAANATHTSFTTSESNGIISNHRLLTNNTYYAYDVVLRACP